MIIAGRQDKPRVVEILTAAFLDNKSVNHLILQDRLKLFRIHQLMDYSFEMCMLFGQVFLSEDRKVCALVLYPEMKKAGFRLMVLDLKLIFNAIGLGNLWKAMRRERLIRGTQIEGRKAYLWFICVDPRYQRSGLGKRLMKELIIKCVYDNRPIYLETSTIDNLPWYKKFGYEVYDTLDLSFNLYFLRRLC